MTGDRPRPDAPDRSDRRFTWRSAAYVAALLALVASVGLLGRAGLEILRNEDTGQVVSDVTDPSAPGFEALVTPTATAVLFEYDASGAFSGATMLALGGGESGGGTVVLLPATTVLELPFSEQGEYTLGEILELTDREGLTQRIEVMFGAAMQEVIDVPMDQWASLVQPLGGITVDNPVALTVTDPSGATTVYEEGPVDLAPEDVGPFLTTKAEGETEPVRLSRVEAFWTAWLAVLGERGDPGLVPGETDVGLGRFVRTLARGPSTVTPLPVDTIPIPGIPAASNDLFRPDQPAVDELVAQAIPFPTGVDRPRTRLVNAVDGDPATTAEAASVLTRAGAEVAVIANADTFDQERTAVVYFAARFAEDAEAMGDALGGARVERGEVESSTVDVVVVLGADYDPIGSGDEPTGTTIAVTPTTVPIAGDEGVTPGAPGGELPG